MTKIIINDMDAAAFRDDRVTGKRLNITINRYRCRSLAGFRGRLAQMDRALVSGTRGRGFESHIAYQWSKGAASV